MNKTYAAIASLVAFAVAVWAATPSRLEFRPIDPLPAVDIIPGTEERRVRQGGAASTEWVVLSVHGFSASRQETAPLAQMVADGLGANLLEVRLSGHGLVREPLAGVKAEHWLADGERALREAAGMGNRIVAIGTSTGGTLLAAMLEREVAERIDTLVLISPNFGPIDESLERVIGAGGLLLAWLVEGFERCWEPLNELQERYWSTCYPTSAAVEVMRLVALARDTIVEEVQQDVLVFYSPDDGVVSGDAIAAAYETFDTPLKELVVVNDSGDPNDHVIVGDIMSPGTTDRIAAQILDFIQRPAR